MLRGFKFTLIGGALGAIALAAAPPAEAGAAGTRPGRATGGSGTVQASGTPRYGYGGYGHGYHPGGYYRHGSYYWPSPWGFYPSYGWGWGFYAGWPYYPRVYGVPATGYRSIGQAPGTVETDIRPKKAEVLIDGEVVGQARDFNGNWDLLQLAPGSYEVSFSNPGYMTLSVPLEVEPGGYYHFDDQLQRGSGRDPRSIERPPPERGAEDRPPDPGQQSLERPAGAEGSEPPAAGSLRTGFLALRASPGDAVVYLDGEFLARADELERLHGAIPVAVGNHRIEVVRPGYASQRRDVLVNRDEPVTIRLELQPDD